MRTSKGNGLSAAGGTRVRPHQELPGKEGNKILGWERLGLASEKKKDLRILETSHKFRASTEGHFQRVQRLWGRKGLGLTLNSQAGLSVLSAGHRSVSPSLGPLRVGEDQSVCEPILLKRDPIAGRELETRITMETAAPTLSSLFLIAALGTK